MAFEQCWLGAREKRVFYPQKLVSVLLRRGFSFIGEGTIVGFSGVAKLTSAAC